MYACPQAPNALFQPYYVLYLSSIIVHAAAAAVTQRTSRFPKLSDVSRYQSFQLLLPHSMPYHVTERLDAPSSSCCCCLSLASLLPSPSYQVPALRKWTKLRYWYLASLYIQQSIDYSAS